MFLVLSILFMWGFGISLLLVIMNISIGFADNEADFRLAFLEWTRDHEIDKLEDYLRAYVESEEHPGDYDSAISFYADQFDPKNTNLRFSATDMEGNLIVQNDPSFRSDMPVMVSSVDTFDLELEMRSYVQVKQFSNPITSYSEIVYGDNSQYLDDPSDYRYWYFADNDVDKAFHENLTAKVFSDPYTEERSFPTEASAAMHDYQTAR